MLEDSGAPVVLTQARLRERVPEGPWWCLSLDAMAVELGAERSDDPGPQAGPDDLAYVIYTSGSTGRPKGVMIPHRALTNFVAAAREVYGIRHDDRVLQFSSIAFDIAVEEIFPALVSGATLVLRAEEMESIAVLLRRAAVAGVTVLDLPTAYWHELVRELAAGAVQLPGCVRTVISGGERLLPEAVA